MLSGVSFDIRKMVVLKQQQLLSFCRSCRNSGNQSLKYICDRPPAVWVNHPAPGAILACCTQSSDYSCGCPINPLRRILYSNNPFQRLLKVLMTDSSSFGECVESYLGAQSRHCRVILNLKALIRFVFRTLRFNLFHNEHNQIVHVPDYSRHGDIEPKCTL